MMVVSILYRSSVWLSLSCDAHDIVALSLSIEFSELLGWPIICCFICLFSGSPVSCVLYVGVWSFVRVRGGGDADGPLFSSVFVDVIV